MQSWVLFYVLRCCNKTAVELFQLRYWHTSKNTKEAAPLSNLWGKSSTQWHGFYTFIKELTTKHWITLTNQILCLTICCSGLRSSKEYCQRKGSHFLGKRRKKNNRSQPRTPKPLLTSVKNNITWRANIREIYDQERRTKATLI